VKERDLLSHMIEEQSMEELILHWSKLIVWHVWLVMLGGNYWC